MELCEQRGIKLFDPPADLATSKRFRNKFNEMAQHLGLDLVWDEDATRPFVVNRGEITVDAVNAGKYGVRMDVYTECSPDTMPQVSRKDLRIPITHFNKTFVADVRRVLGAMETRRLALVKKSALHNERIIYRPPMEKLNAVERAALNVIRDRIVPIVNRIEARQQNPHADELAAWMSRKGDYYSRIMFQRIRYDSCAGIPYAPNKDCSLFPFYPDAPSINGLLPWDMKLAEFKKYTKDLPSTDEALRPTTVLERTEDGRITVTPMPRHWNFIDDHQLLTDELRQLAALEVGGEKLDPLTRAQLIACANFCDTGSADDEVAMMQATIDARGSNSNLTFYFLPSESYWRDNKKFPYMLMAGVRDRAFMKEIQATTLPLSTIENTLGGIANYRPRAIPRNSARLDVFDTAITGGFLLSYPYAEPGGWNAPNYHYPDSEGRTQIVGKMIMTANDVMGSPRRADQLKAIYQGVTGMSIAHLNVKKLEILYTYYHEAGHLVGPQRDHQTPGGSMGAVFGKHWGSFDEPKADATAVQSALLGMEKGKISKERARNFLALVVANQFKGYPGLKLFKKGIGDHSFGSVLFVGACFKNKAFTLETVGRKTQIKIDYDRLGTTIRAMWKDIIQFQANGDIKGALAYAKERAALIPQAADALILKSKKGRRYSFYERRW